MKNVNKQRRNFISLSELEYGPLEFIFRRTRVHLSKLVRIIAIKTERTLINFLGDVVVAVALDLELFAPLHISHNAPYLPPPPKKKKKKNA